MLGYISKRIAYFVPTMVAVFVITFFLLDAMPSDPIVNIMHLRGVISESGMASADYYREYEKIGKEFHYDKPSFYISVSPDYIPPDVREQCDIYYSAIANKLLHNNHSFEKTIKIIDYLKTPSARESQALQSAVASGSIDNISKQLPKEMSKLLTADTWLFYPKIHWHGSQNRFHFWMVNLIRSDFGISIIDGRPVASKLAKALSWTLALVLLSMLLSLILAIPMGIYDAIEQGGWISKWISGIAYVLYSIPVFWFATMMLVFFTTSEYGSWTNIFSSGNFSTAGPTGPWHNISSLILPAICLSIHRIAYLIRQMSVSVRDEMRKDYFSTALSKGLSRSQAIWSHVVPNALVPIVTVITAMIPASLAGSVVVEVIFNIPGMGRLLFQSIFNQDWNVLFGDLVILSLFTMIFYLIGDLLYAWLNPQIRFQ